MLGYCISGDVKPLRRKNACHDFQKHVEHIQFYVRKHGSAEEQLPSDAPDAQCKALVIGQFAGDRINNTGSVQLFPC